MKWVVIFLISAVGLSARGDVASTDDSQKEYERSVNAVVRNKIFYKSGHIEVGATAGVMPYDSVINHLMAGGRATWHLSDHYGWEIIDAQLSFPTVTSFTLDTASGKKTGGQPLSNLQTVKLKILAGTNFLLSPFYGKIRFFGRQVLHIDMYVVLGFGMASTDTLRFTGQGPDQPVTETVVKSSWDPMGTFGLGFRVFLNSAMGLTLDMRDYLVHSEVYGKRSLKSNFAVFAGLSFFLPTF